MRESSKSLPAHEWVAVLIILSVMVLFISVISLRKIELEETHLLTFKLLNQEIEIYLQGAVTSPGRMIVKKGVTLEQILKSDILTDFADLSLLNIKKKLRSGEHIVIPEIQYVTVFVTGAVEMPVFMTLPKNIKINDLLPFLKLNNEANLKRLPKNHCFVEGDRITIPIKKRSL